MRHTLTVGAVVLGFWLAGVGVARAAFDAFLQMGDIKGESTDKDHKDWISVLSYNMGVTQPGAARSAMRSAARVATREFTITKNVDATSPKLMAACASGRHFTKVTLATPFMKYELHDVFVSSVRAAGAGGLGVSETVVLSYGSILMQQVSTVRAQVLPGSVAPNKAAVNRRP